MASKLTENVGEQNYIHGISEKNFAKLSEEQKGIVLAGIADAQNKSQEGGQLGKFLGTNPKNASMHIALILCVILLLYCGFDLFHSFLGENTINKEIWDAILPIITLSLGYIFGKGTDKE